MKEYIVYVDFLDEDESVASALIKTSLSEDEIQENYSSRQMGLEKYKRRIRKR